MEEEEVDAERMLGPAPLGDVPCGEVPRMGVSAEEVVPGQRVGEEREAGVAGAAAAAVSPLGPEAIRWLVRIIAGTGMVVVQEGSDCSDPVLCTHTAAPFRHRVGECF